MNAGLVLLFLLLGGLVLAVFEALGPPEAIGDLQVRAFRLFAVDALRTYSVLAFLLVYVVSVGVDVSRLLRQSF